MCIPQGFHCQALYNAGHHLCLYILEGPHCTLSDASGPLSSPCPMAHTSALIYTQTYMCFQSIGWYTHWWTINEKLLSVSQEKLLSPLVWWPMASWEGNWAQLERKPGGGRHAPEAAPPALCPYPPHFPDCAQSDPNSEKKTKTISLCLRAHYYISC